MGKAKLLAEIRRYTDYEEMDQFIYFVHAQMYRHIFKNSAKFIHAIEKWLVPNFALNEYKKVYILKFWDVYSAEVIMPSKKEEAINDFRDKVMSFLYQDTDTMLNLIRLCESESHVKYLLQTQFKINVEETLRKSCLFFGNFSKEFEGKGKLEYYNFYLDGVKNQILDGSDEEEMGEDDNCRMIDRIIEDVRQVDNNKKFTVFPVSYGTDIDMKSWCPAPDSKLMQYLDNLEHRKFILGSENHVNQVHISSQPLYDVKENANFMIGCADNPINILYVMCAKK